MRIPNFINKRRLKDERYSFLFEKDESDEIVAFDTETTGLNPKTDELLSIGAVKIRGNKILTSERLELVIKTESKISPESIKVHQLRHIDVAKGIELQEALEQFLDFIGSRPLVNYFIEFDAAMINKYLKPWLGITLPNKQIEVSAMYYDYKAKQIRSQMFFDGDFDINLSFSSIRKNLELPERELHNPFYDALTAALAYVKLKQLK